MENNQNQFHDINDDKIIEIIKPYQEKINKLQEEISQKDLEIAQLKYNYINIIIQIKIIIN